MTDYKVHPVADLFPMLPDDELRDLAEDIKVRGQLQPIVLDKVGEAILDGRNRFAACKLAGVEPQFVTYDGDDPDGYALAVNIHRRHMTKGQQALVVAKACLETRQPIREAAKTHGVVFQRISQANVIIEHAADFVDDILGGFAKFDAAYEIAKHRKQEKLARVEDAESIRAEAPDLADAVAEEEITLAAAKEELRLRQLDAERADRVAKIDALLAGRKGNAKRQAASYFRSYGQLTLGEGTEVQLQMLHDKRHLPVPINEIDVVRLGALTPSDVADLRMTRDHEEKLRAAAAKFELSGIDMLANLLRDTGCPDVDSMF